MQALNSEQVKLLSDFNKPFKMWLFTLIKLPSALFMGVKVHRMTTEVGQTSVPYGWRSQNPFQSIYFAAQCSAGEMSTGLPAMLALKGRGKVSMLVSHIEASFVKKATSKTIFTCNDVAAVFETVERAIATKEAQTIVMTTTGVQATGETVAVMRVTWSFKAK